MAQSQRKSVKELLAMSSAEVREYLQTLLPSEQRVVGEELYKAKLSIDIQRSAYHLKENSQNESQ